MNALLAAGTAGVARFAILRRPARIVGGAAALSALILSSTACSSNGTTSVLPRTPVSSDTSSSAQAPAVSVVAADMPGNDPRSNSASNIDVRPDAVTGATYLTNVVIKVPNAVGSAASASISVNGGAAKIANLSKSTPGCVLPSGSTILTCTVAVNAPAGENYFAFNTFSGANGTGSRLASGTVPQAIAASGTSVAVALHGNIASVGVMLVNATPRECGSATTIPVYVTARDSAKNALIEPAYNTAIGLRDSDTSGATKLSVATLTSSATPVALSYSGGVPGAPATISATASGASAGNALLTPAQSLYVMDAGAGRIDVWSPSSTGNVAPSRYIQAASNTLDAGARQLALSSKCELYIADSTNGIYAFAAGASGTQNPLIKIAGTNTTWNPNSTGGPLGIAVDKAGNVYAPLGTGGIGVWAAGANGNVAPGRTIDAGTSKITTASLLALDGSGQLYVLGFGNVMVFAAGASGNAVPLRTLNYTTNCVNGMTVDPAGDIYLAFCDGTISEYKAGASGYAAPQRSINEGNVPSPSGAAIDYAGNFFTVNSYVKGVVSFGPAQSGNATPRTNIIGTNTTLYEPYQLTL